MPKHCPHKKKGICFDCYDKQVDDELEGFDETTKTDKTDKKLS
jgi:hypothetical protein